LAEFAKEEWPKESSTPWIAIPKPTVSSTVEDKREPEVIAEEKKKQPFVLAFIETREITYPKTKRDFWMDGVYSTLVNYAGQYQL
jgi:hypothetical protein